MTKKPNSDYHFLFGELRSISISEEQERPANGNYAARIERVVDIAVETPHQRYEYSRGLSRDEYALIPQLEAFSKGDRVAVVVSGMGKTAKGREWAMFRDLLDEVEAIQYLAKIAEDAQLASA